MNTPQHIIWLQTAFLGDTVITAGAFELVKKKLPGVKQYLITNGAGKSALAGGSSALESIVVFDKRRQPFWQAFPAIKKHFQKILGLPRQTTILLQPHRSLRSTLLAKYLGYETVTYEESTWSWLANRRVARVMVFHEAVRIALLLEPLGVAREDLITAMPKLYPLNKPASPTLLEWSKSLPKELIGIAPGSVWGTKCWLPEGYAELSRQLLSDNPERAIVLIGGEADVPIANSILQLAGKPERMFNLCNMTSLPDLLWLYNRLSLVISNDSSPVHYASAFQIPTVAIFGATIPAQGFGPLASRSQVVERLGLSCRPCSDHGPKVCPLGHFLCMRQITADQVFAACRQVLSN